MISRDLPEDDFEARQRKFNEYFNKVYERRSREKGKVRKVKVKDEVLKICINFLVKRYPIEYKQIAQDLLQDVFLYTYLRIQQYREDGDFLAWIIQITRNRCIDYLKKDSRRLLSTIRQQDVDTDREEQPQTDYFAQSQAEQYWRDTDAAPYADNAPEDKAFIGLTPWQETLSHERKSVLTNQTINEARWARCWVTKAGKINTYISEIEAKVLRLRLKNGTRVGNRKRDWSFEQIVKFLTPPDEYAAMSQEERFKARNRYEAAHSRAISAVRVYALEKRPELYGGIEVIKHLFEKAKKREPPLTDRQADVFQLRVIDHQEKVSITGWWDELAKACDKVVYVNRKRTRDP